MRCAVLLEGDSDVPVMREILTRKFGLKEKIDFSLHPHAGKGSLPLDMLGPPPQKARSLLELLPATLRGKHQTPVVLVLIDLDNDDLSNRIAELTRMLRKLPQRPPLVVFCFAIEEVESWFLSDINSLRAAFPSRVKANLLRTYSPDSIVSSWELLAAVLGYDSEKSGPISKVQWAEKIAPHMNLESPRSPSLIHLLTRLRESLVD
jgi:hypothetical protein